MSDLTKEGKNIILLFFVLLLLLLISLIRVMKSINRITAVFIDFLLIGGFATYFLHHQVAVKIASNYAVYFWDFIFFCLTCFVYYGLLMVLAMKVPKIAILINYIIAWIGTFVIYSLLSLVFFNNLPRLLNNPFLSDVTNIIIVSVLAFFTFNIRRRIFIENIQQNPKSEKILVQN